MEFAKRRGHEVSLGLVTKKTDSKSRKKIRKEIEEALKTSEFPVGLFTTSDILRASVTESAIALERSIYWYLNYRLNLRLQFAVAARQALYYSEFFAIITLSRFLGLALTRILGRSLGIHLETAVNWRKLSFDVNWHNPRSPHLDHYNLLKRKIGDFEFVSERCRRSITELGKPLQKEDREDAVYDLWHDVFQSFRNGAVQERYDLVFIGVIGVSELQGRIHEFHEEERQEILDAYSEWGYRESHIGAFQREVIAGFWEVGGNLLEFLDTLRANIERTPHIREEEKTDLLDWLTRKPSFRH